MCVCMSLRVCVCVCRSRRAALSWRALDPCSWKGPCRWLVSAHGTGEKVEAQGDGRSPAPSPGGACGHSPGALLGGPCLLTAAHTISAQLCRPLCPTPEPPSCPGAGGGLLTKALSRATGGAGEAEGTAAAQRPHRLGRKAKTPRAQAPAHPTKVKAQRRPLPHG